MTVLPDHQIAKICRGGAVTPFDESMVQPASYDCKLGTEFIVFDRHEEMFIDLADVQDGSSRKVHKDDKFVLHPDEFILAVTAETVNIPRDVVARIEGKSSIGRLGIMVHVTAGYIDPGFMGQITLEMVNLRSLPIILRPGQPICQLSFHAMTSPPAKTYTGRYQGARGVEASLYGKGRDDDTELEWESERLHKLSERWQGYYTPPQPDIGLRTRDEVLRREVPTHPSPFPGQTHSVILSDEGPKPFTPLYEAETCVPHGVFRCQTCLEAITPQGSDQEVI